MYVELDAKLCEKYPKIFRDRYAPMNQTAMCWGFDCGSGWYQIIDTLCAVIQNHIDNYSMIKNGVVEKPHQVVATQVKEKYGTLRFYVDYADDYVYGAIAMAESMSARTCEICGAAGKIRGDFWLSTRCDEHAEDS